MMLSEKEREQQRQKRLKQQVREIEWRRFSDPERDHELIDVWVAHVWVPDDVDVPEKGEWVFAGFRRKRNRRKPQTMGRFFGKVRRQLGLHKGTSILLMDLDMATRRIRGEDQQWRYRAPQFQTRKAKMEQRTPKPVGKKTKQRAKVKAHILNKKTTKYLAIGRRSWEKRDTRYLYLGPLRSDKKRQAQFEAKRMFPAWDELLVLSTSELSKPLRNAMVRNRRVQAGVTKFVWPEVPPSFDEIWRKFVKRLVKKEFANAITLDDQRLVDIELALQSEWELQERPWLTLSWFRKQIKPWRPACAKKRKSASKRAAATRKKSKSSAPKRGKSSKPRTSTSRRKKRARSTTTSRTKSTVSRKLRSIVSRVRSVISSGRATPTKAGRTKTGSVKRKTNGRNVRGSSSRSAKLVVRAKLTRMHHLVVRGKLKRRR